MKDTNYWNPEVGLKITFKVVLHHVILITGRVWRPEVIKHAYLIQTKTIKAW